MNRGRRVVVTALALAVTLALAGVAAAAPPQEPPGQAKKTAPETGYTLTIEDAAGNVLSTEERTGGMGEQRTASPLSTEVASGCASVDAWVRGSTLLGFTAYRFHQVKHWCWSYPHITSVNAGTYFSDVDANYHVRDVSGFGWFYTWRGSGRGGHYSFRQARIENCIFRYGCLRTEYPWVEIWVNGNGAWTYNAGT